MIGSLKALFENYKVCHRDLKPENILVLEDDETLLIDFGSALKFKSETKGFSSVVGTENYMAPEIIIKGDRILDEEVSKLRIPKLTLKQAT